MPTMATTLTEYSDEANSRTYTVPGHSIAKPKLLLQKRQVGAAGGKSSQDTISVVFGTANAAGAILPNRIAFEIVVRRPVEALAADVTAALALFKEVVASDEFTAVVNTQNYLKA